MTWCTFLAVLGPLLVGCRAEPPDEKKPPADTRQEAEAPDRQRVGDGIYAVLREGRREEVGLARQGEVVAVDHHRYSEKAAAEPPTYLALRASDRVPLVLASRPEAVKDEAGQLRIHLTLARENAEALERLTRGNVGRQVAVLIAGDVVTVHKVRDPISGGKVQVTCCAEGTSDYLLKQLQSQWQKRAKEKGAEKP